MKTVNFPGSFAPAELKLTLMCGPSKLPAGGVMWPLKAQHYRPLKNSFAAGFLIGFATENALLISSLHEINRRVSSA